MQVIPFLIFPYMHQVLSTNEKRLCTSLRLHPRLYISYKTCLLRDHLSKKKGQIPKPVHPSGLDKLHRYVRQKQIHVNRPLQRFQKLVRNVISGKRSSTFSSPPVGFLLTDPSTSFKVSQSFPTNSWG